MIPLDIRPNLELNPWNDMAGLDSQGAVERVGLLPHATDQGRPIFALLIRLEDGRTVVAQTTWTLMEAAVRALGASPVAEFDQMEHGS
ncbi:hypothetical protein C1I98_11135 [Spongiactinospora gelatinilytica]|uniref:Uncharacterized protein n=1 Tax=Spongiactinospora gelatinilytica TaxID=2666298 RepID=A0A2W2GMP9_9ACTN|nr:hypothetical protein [Spongiactinospora gelatinilytica]PZG49861.1 hypothetical protein C1I98_11135 [Spongiactinospora gelatinilytica]